MIGRSSGPVSPWPAVGILLSCLVISVIAFLPIANCADCGGKGYGFPIKPERLGKLELEQKRPRCRGKGSVPTLMLWTGRFAEFASSR